MGSVLGLGSSPAPKARLGGGDGPLYKEGSFGNAHSLFPGSGFLPWNVERPNVLTEEPRLRPRLPSQRAQLRMALDWIGFSYAALVASGGIIGYAKAGSVPSLAAGLLFGGLAGLGAYQISQDPKNIWVSLAASGTLAGIMGMRFYNSGKFMPAGLIAGASLLMVGRLGLKMLDKPRQA